MINHAATKGEAVNAQLYVTYVFSRYVIGTTRFHESRPITPSEARELLNQRYTYAIANKDFADVRRILAE
jgi:hypothetical protein